MTRSLAALFLLVMITGCSLLSFREYDYKRQRNAHIEVKGMNAEVHKVRGGLLVGKKMKFGKPGHPLKQKKPSGEAE